MRLKGFIRPSVLGGITALAVTGAWLIKPQVLPPSARVGGTKVSKIPSRPQLTVVEPHFVQITKVEPEKKIRETVVSESNVIEPPPEKEKTKVILASELPIPPYVLQQIELEQKELENEKIDTPEKPVAPFLSQRKSSASTFLTAQNAKQSVQKPSNQFSYRPISFQPGLTKSGKSIMPGEIDMAKIIKAVAGPPDYSLASKVPQYDNLLSLGNGGILTLEVVEGWILDESGPDFVVFENPFVYKGADGINQIYAETAIVSVAEENKPEMYKTFPCDSLNTPYRGCAGVVPDRYSPLIPLDQVGGDQFDLSQLGISRVKFIRIEDTGNNSSSFLEGTEGFDMDAMGIFHFSN